MIINSFIEESFKEAIWNQFGASIDMLENAISLCPDELWDTEKRFWYNAYHCLFYLDYYLTLQPEKFFPPSPFTLSELDRSGAVPGKPYTKEELLIYLQKSRNKLGNLISDMTEEVAKTRWKNHLKNYSVIEMMLYNMRHVQHHAAQLNLLLRQRINDAPRWVSQTGHKIAE
jgi:hypothetical protein